MYYQRLIIIFTKYNNDYLTKRGIGIAVSNFDTLKQNLLDISASLSNGICIPISLGINGLVNNIELVNGATYKGMFYNIGQGIYFSLVATSNVGDTIRIAYSNGRWFIRNDLLNLPQIEFTIETKVYTMPGSGLFLILSRPINPLCLPKIIKQVQLHDGNQWITIRIADSTMIYAHYSEYNSLSSIIVPGTFWTESGFADNITILARITVNAIS